MSHFGDQQDKYKNLMPLMEWRTLNSQVTTLVNTWSGRDDLVAFIGPEQGDATAFFSPERCEIQVNTDISFGEGVPATSIGDMNDRTVQFDHLKASGAIFHEASHAKFTTWNLRSSMRDLEERENAAMHILEESRIEGLGVLHNPENTAFLRACALEIVLSDMADEKVQQMSGIRQAAHLLALGIARVDAGVLKDEDVKLMRETIETIIEPKTIKKFRNIWLQFQKITNPATQINEMYRLAREWAKLLDETAKEEDEQAEKNAAARQMMRDLMKSLGGPGGQMDQTESKAQGDAQDQQRQEKWNADQKAKDERNKERGGNQDAAKKVFDKDVPVDNQSGGQLEYGQTRSAIAHTREPSSEERKAAILIGRALEKAKYHDRIRIESNSIMPPGRLSTRATVQAAAYKANNIRVQTEPWKRIQRKHQIDPNLKVGIAMDISGSMSGAMEPMGVTGWLMAEAVRRIQGTFAMVSYGHEVTPLIKPGQHQKDVNIYTCPDGSEAFQLGFQALDGILGMLDGSGARLLVFVSDFNYKQQEVGYSKKWLKRCGDEGVAVVILGYGNPYGAAEAIKGTNAELVYPAATPVEVAIQIGQAAVRALERAGKSQ